MKIRTATESDKSFWLFMRQALWPHASLEEHSRDIARYLLSPDKWIGVAEDPKSVLVGFVEVSTRYDYVEGIDKSPVAYLEGLYVKESHRGHGVARSLVVAAEQWAKQNAMTEIASDVEIDNQPSIQMHKKLGFIEASWNVHFMKRITK